VCKNDDCCHNCVVDGQLIVPADVTAIMKKHPLNPYPSTAPFFKSAGLTSVVAPSVTFVDHAAFRGCPDLTKVDLPSATHIHVDAFSHSALTSISMPKARRIGERAFYGCSGLTTVIRPRDVDLSYAGGEPFGDTPLSDQCGELSLNSDGVSPSCWRPDGQRYQHASAEDDLCLCGPAKKGKKAASDKEDPEA
jgi:hypothetical protein